MKAFGPWLDTFLHEKGIDGEEVLDVVAWEGTPNAIPVACLVDALKRAPEGERKAVRALLVKVDFRNGDVRAVLRHIARAIAYPMGVERT